MQSLVALTPDASRLAEEPVLCEEQLRTEARQLPESSSQLEAPADAGDRKPLV